MVVVGLSLRLSLLAAVAVLLYLASGDARDALLRGDLGGALYRGTEFLVLLQLVYRYSGNKLVIWIPGGERIADLIHGTEGLSLLDITLLILLGVAELLEPGARRHAIALMVVTVGLITLVHVFPAAASRASRRRGPLIEPKETKLEAEVEKGGDGAGALVEGIETSVVPGSPSAMKRTRSASPKPAPKAGARAPRKRCPRGFLAFGSFLHFVLGAAQQVNTTTPLPVSMTNAPLGGSDATRPPVVAVVPPFDRGSREGMNWEVLHRRLETILEEVGFNARYSRDDATKSIRTYHTLMAIRYDDEELLDTVSGAKIWKVIFSPIASDPDIDDETFKTIRFLVPHVGSVILPARPELGALYRDAAVLIMVRLERLRPGRKSPPPLESSVTTPATTQPSLRGTSSVTTTTNGEEEVDLPFEASGRRRREGPNFFETITDFFMKITDQQAPPGAMTVYSVSASLTRGFGSLPVAILLAGISGGFFLAALPVAGVSVIIGAWVSFMWAMDYIAQDLLVSLDPNVWKQKIEDAGGIPGLSTNLIIALGIFCGGFLSRNFLRSCFGAPPPADGGLPGAQPGAQPGAGGGVGNFIRGVLGGGGNAPIPGAIPMPFGVPPAGAALYGPAAHPSVPPHPGAALVPLDGRVHPTKVVQGSRLRDWKEVQMDARGLTIPDYDTYLEGPSMTMDAVKKWGQRTGGPIEQYQTAETNGTFPAKSVHRYEAQFLAVFLELFCTVDQGDPTGMLCVELAIRRFGLIFHVLERAKTFGVKADWSISEPYMGCPLLQMGTSLTTLKREEWLAKRLKEKWAVEKEVRKASEVRDSHKKHK